MKGREGKDVRKEGQDGRTLKEREKIKGRREIKGSRGTRKGRKKA